MIRSWDKRENINSKTIQKQKADVNLLLAICLNRKLDKKIFGKISALIIDAKEERTRNTLLENTKIKNKNIITINCNGNKIHKNYYNDQFSEVINTFCGVNGNGLGKKKNQKISTNIL